MDQPIEFVDPIVARVASKLASRSRVGVEKYGVTLRNARLSRLAALRHAQEEALDLANYLEVEIERAEAELAEEPER